MTTVKPGLVVETGTFLGVSTLYMAEGLKRNGRGKIITCEPDKDVFGKAKEKIDGSGLGKWVDYRCESSMNIKVPGAIDVLFCDSLPELREPPPGQSQRRNPDARLELSSEDRPRSRAAHGTGRPHLGGAAAHAPGTGAGTETGRTQVSLLDFT